MTALRTAQLSAITDARGRAIAEAQRVPLRVQFNPESLELTIRSAIGENEGAKRGSAAARRQQPPQVVSNTTVTLTLQLVFDTTTTGADVRLRTAPIAALMQPAEQQVGRETKKVPALVAFEWSSFVFEGAISDYKETIDFFAPEGLPQRATLSLTLTQQDKPFPQPRPGTAADTGDAFSDLAPAAPLGAGQSVDDVAAAGGDRGAAGALAAANGIENRRNPGVGAVAAPRGGGRGPAAFASGGAGAGAGLSLSAGASASASASLGAGFGASAIAGAGAGAFASAGIGGTAGGLGAFGGLKLQANASPPRPRVQLSLAAPGLSASATAGAGMGAGAALGLSGKATAGVSIGGSATASAGAGLSVDVGAGASLSAILFID